MLPTDAKARKAVPLCTGVLDYFPDALAAVAAVSKAGNDQHNPGQDLHWSRDKSKDQADCLLRHLTERGTIDTDGHRHSAKAAWRALALLQEEIERDEGLPMSRGSRFDAPIMAAYPYKTDAQPTDLVDHSLPKGVRVAGCVVGECYYCGGYAYAEAPSWCPCPNNHLPATRLKAEPDGDTHMPPMQEMHDETGVPWGAASPKQPMRLAPPNMCGDCGADLGETGHFASCLSQAAHTRR